MNFQENKLINYSKKNMSLDKFKKTNTKIKDLIVVNRNIFIDTRGSLLRIFSKKGFNKLGYAELVDSINVTEVKNKGTIKGFHFQKPPHSEIKIVTCIKGSISDVAIDLRSSSKTFLSHHTEKLSERNKKSIVIPKGFAHGFQALEDNCIILYIHSNSYQKKSESGLNVLDKKLNVKWPIKINKISARDRGFKYIDNNFEGLKIE